MHPSAQMRTPWFCLTVGLWLEQAGVLRAAALGWGRVVSTVPGTGPVEGLPRAACPYLWPSHCVQGTRCTPPSGSRNITGRSLGSAASGVRSSCTPVTPSCRVSQAPTGLGWARQGRRACVNALGSSCFWGVSLRAAGATGRQEKWELGAALRRESRGDGPGQEQGVAEVKMWAQNGPDTLWGQIRGSPRPSAGSPGAIACSSAELMWGHSHSLLYQLGRGDIGAPRDSSRSLGMKSLLLGR